MTTAGGCGHWDETCLVHEMMTPFLSGTEQPISTITVGSLDDLGYIVKYEAADDFTEDDVNPSCLCPSARRRGLRHLQEIEDNGLSPEGEQKARDYGKKILEERKAKWPDDDGSGPIADMGMKVLIVLYSEEGSDVIHSVRVEA